MNISKQLFPRAAEAYAGVAPDFGSRGFAREAQ
jgi:hypothetical protein